jgi:hypothetical protein
MAVDPDIVASALTEDDCPLTERELEVLRASRTGASRASAPSAWAMGTSTCGVAIPSWQPCTSTTPTTLPGSSGHDVHQRTTAEVVGRMTKT